MTTVKVKGLKELNSFLQQLPAKLEATVLRSGMRDGAKVVEEQVKQNLRSNGSVDTERLLGSVRVSTRLRRGKVYASVRAGGRSGAKKVMQGKGGRLRVGYEQAYYAMWVEYGTSAHAIRPRKPGGFLAIAPGVFVRGVEHPGSRPKPFMRPALELRAQEAVIATANHMKRRLSGKRFGMNTSGVEVAAA